MHTNLDRLSQVKYSWPKFTVMFAAHMINFVKCVILALYEQSLPLKIGVMYLRERE